MYRKHDRHLILCALLLCIALLTHLPKTLSSGRANKHKSSTSRELENFHEKWKEDAKVFTINKSNYRFMYFGNNELDAENGSIRRVVITVHGLGGNSGASYEYARRHFLRLKNKDTAIIAPSFSTKKWQRFKFRHVVKWDNTWPLGGVPVKPRNINIFGDMPLNSYSMMDYMVYKAVSNFKNLDEIVFVGFSGGSQLLQRYLSMSPYVRSLYVRGFEIRGYLISSGDYMYFNPYRPSEAYKNKCSRPKKLASCMKESQNADFWHMPIGACDGEYNMYKYGTEGLMRSGFPYFKSSAVYETLSSSVYMKYKITYVIGERDKNPPRSNKCPAQVQGDTRIQRLLLFLAHIKKIAPNTVHEVLFVPGCQHNEHCVGMSGVIRNSVQPIPDSDACKLGDLSPHKSDLTPYECFRDQKYQESAHGVKTLSWMFS